MLLAPAVKCVTPVFEAHLGALGGVVSFVSALGSVIVLATVCAITRSKCPAASS